MTQHSKHWNRWHVILFIIILLLGTSLRAYHFDEKSVWLDEGITNEGLKQDTFTDMIEFIITDESNPPLYWIMMRPFYVRGMGVEFLRLFSVLVGSLSIIWMYLLGRELIDRKGGLIVALLFAVSPSNILFSQQARTWMWFVFLTLLSSLFFMRWIKKNGLAWPYVVSALLMIYSAYFGLFVLLVHLLTVFIYKKEVLKRFAMLLSIIFVLYIPQLVLLVRHLPLINQKFYRPLMFRLGWPQEIAQFGVFYFIGMALLFGMVFFLFHRKIIGTLEKLFNWAAKKPLFCFSFLFIWCILFLTNLPRLVSPSFFIRYPLFLFPAAMLIATALLLKIKSRSLQIIFFGVMIALSFVGTYYYLTNPITEQWDEAAAHIQSSGYSTLLLNADYIHMPLEVYMDTADYLILSSPKSRVVEDHIAFLENLPNQPDRLVLVLSHAYFPEKYVEELLRFYTLEDQKQLIGIKLIYLSRLS